MLLYKYSRLGGEMVDTLDSKSGASGMEVRFLSKAKKK